MMVETKHLSSFTSFHRILRPFLGFIVVTKLKELGHLALADRTSLTESDKLRIT